MIRNHRAAVLAAALSGVLCLPALARQAPPPPDRPADEAQPQLQDMLRRRLGELGEEQDRLRKAIDALDKGASPEDVMRELRPPRGSGDGPDGEGRPRERWRDWREGRGAADGNRPDRAEGPEGSPPTDWRDPAVRERIAKFIREHPELSEPIERIKQDRPEFAERMSFRLAPRIAEIMEVSDRDPELADLKLKELGNGLATMNAFRDTRAVKDDPEKLAAARAILVARVADQFDIRARLRQHDIEQLRQRLDTLQADLDRQLSQRSQEIQKRVDEMMSGKAPMDVFGDGPGKGPRGGPDRPGKYERPDGSTDKKPAPREPR